MCNCTFLLEIYNSLLLYFFKLRLYFFMLTETWVCSCQRNFYFPVTSKKCNYNFKKNTTAMSCIKVQLHFFIKNVTDTNFDWEIKISQAHDKTAAQTLIIGAAPPQTIFDAHTYTTRTHRTPNNQIHTTPWTKYIICIWYYKTLYFL
jgi:hypothetical protein